MEWIGIERQGWEGVEGIRDDVVRRAVLYRTWYGCVILASRLLHVLHSLLGRYQLAVRTGRQVRSVLCFCCKNKRAEIHFMSTLVGIQG